MLAFSQHRLQRFQVRIPGSGLVVLKYKQPKEISLRTPQPPSMSLPDAGGPSFPTTTGILIYYLSLV